jgi:hypothetical protein
MKLKTLLSALVGAGFLLVASVSQALLITPSTTSWTTTNNSNPNADAIEALVGASFDLTLLYKAEVGGSDAGGFDDSYDTLFTNSTNDPADALITYISGSSISCPTCYLSVKGGSQTTIIVCV